MKKNSQDNKNKWLTPKEAANLLMISPITIRQWAQKGKINAYTTAGGHRRFKLEDINEFIEKHNLKNSRSDELKILVIDDDQSFLNFIRDLFDNEKFTNIHIETSDNGFDGGLKVLSFKPDIILLDLRMNGIDGFEVCQQVKSNANTSHIRVIVLTGICTQDVQDRVKNLGAESCLSKPLNVTELFSQIGISENQ